MANLKEKRAAEQHQAVIAGMKRQQNEQAMDELHNIAAARGLEITHVSIDPALFEVVVSDGEHRIRVRRYNTARTTKQIPADAQVNVFAWEGDRASANRLANVLLTAAQLARVVDDYKF